jgi:autotransporter translocation and assembly factor TamB
VRRAARAAALVTILGVAIVAAALGWALGTAPGARWLLEQGARQGQVSIEYAALRGSLLGGLEIDALEVAAGDGGARVERATLRWQPWELRRRRVVVDELLAHGIVVRTAPPPPDSGDEPRIELPALPAVDLPLAVEVSKLELRELRVGDAGAPPVVELLRLALRVSGDTGCRAHGRAGRAHARRLAARRRARSVGPRRGRRARPHRCRGR